MEIFIGTVYFVLGTLIGSFLNVVVLRHNTGRGFMGRSSCFSCGHILAWYELIPVFSFLARLGRCGTCNSKISWQYPLVELFTGLVFLGIFAKYPSLYLLASSGVGGILNTAFLMIIFSILIVIFVYDIKHKIIPDAPVYTFIGLSFIGLFVGLPAGINTSVLPFQSGFHIAMPYLWDIAAGPILFLFFFALWFFSRGRWMGFGDAKLAIGIGWFLGLSLGISAVVFSFWIGAFISIVIILAQMLYNKKGLTMKSEIPFAPFLILGLMIVFFLNINFFQLLSW